MFKSGICIKHKSIYFILLLISILLLTLYFQNRISNKNYLNQIETNYKKNFDNYNEFFKKELIKFYELQTIYINKNENITLELIKNDKFLKDIKIVNFEKEKISTKYTSEVLKGKSFLDIVVSQDDIFYKVIVPVKNSANIESYVAYTIDSRYFLQSVKDFDNSNGILFTKDNNKNNDVFLNKYKNSDFFNQMAMKCEEEHDKPVVNFEDSFYVKKIMSLKNFKNEDIANAIFFLDITKDKKAFISTVRESIITSIVLFILAAIIVNYFFSFLIKKINENEEELKQINKNLEEMVEKEIGHRLEVQKNALEEKEKNEQLLLQQSKLAMLGEMIGNIAHQWRQPLMQLSAILMYLDAYNEKGKLTSDKLLCKIKDGNSIIDFMSKTIEDFRNYYKPEKQKEEFLIKDSINSALFIVNSALKHANIKVNRNYSDENLSLVSFKNEFSQALLNIITNAKDVLILRAVENPSIDIDVRAENDYIEISLLDNAGGIDEEIIGKIFDPYFTTKHQSQGTGIGLYMTKMIIENNMNGNINIENSNNGAKFIIRLKV